MKNDAYSEEMCATDLSKLKKRVSALEASLVALETSNYAFAKDCQGLKEQNEELRHQIARLEERVDVQKTGNAVEVDMLHDLIAEARNEAEYFRNVVAILQRHDELRYPISVSEHKFPWE